MNIKKILAAASASVLAVSAMAVVASAGEMTMSEGVPFSDDGSGNYQLMILGDDAISQAAGLDVTKVASLDLTFTFDDGSDKGEVDEEGNPVFDWAGGAVVVQSNSLGWAQLGAWENAVGNGKEFEGIKSGVPFHVELANKFAADDGYAAVTLQSYGLEVNIAAITLYDDAGAALLTLPAAETPPAQTPDVTPGDSDGSKAPVSTGVEGVAAVIGVAVVAGGAMVVAKKRK